MKNQYPSLNMLRDLIQIYGAPVALEKLRNKLGDTLNRIDIAFTFLELGVVCQYCHGQKKMEDGNFCPCCMGDPIKFLNNRTYRYKVILQHAESLLSEVFTS